MFHFVCGDRITLFNNNTTAKRDISEFNNGLVFSKDPLQDNHLFEVRIEKKVYTWSGGLEIGVTKCNPECTEIPANATDMKNGTWILSGSSVLKDGRSTLDVYGLNLINIEEGDVVGVMRTDQDELIFSLNGEYKGVAARHIPVCVFVVLDLYGQVTQASVVSYASIENIHSSIISNEIDTYDDSDFTEGNSLLSNLLTNFDVQIAAPVINLPPADEIVSVNDKITTDSDRLRFYERCGHLALISANGRSAERLRPYDEFNNGVVITHRPLRTGELFEIRIDSLVEKWSGSIEVGVTMHNPEFLSFPATMTNLKTGTVMMSGCGILTNGKATRRDYGDFNLDELMVGDRIGLVRYKEGDLHYMINGLDQGVAAKSVPELVWGVVDLYGRTVKVTIVDRDEREEQNLLMRRLNVMRDGQLLQTFPYLREQDSDALTFHTKCGSHVVVINQNRTAVRPNAIKDCNDGIVLTQRALKPNEPFEVKIDKMITKWAGSIEIGVTTHSPNSFEFPSTMTNIRSGTWMMTGNGVTHNGNIVLDDYGINLDRLRVGDRVAVVVPENGSIHLYVNGIDQGEVVANINEPVYGVIDLFGQVAQVTIIDYDFLCCCSTPLELAAFPLTLSCHSDLRFSHVHGKNVRICNNNKTAFRPQPYFEFANAVVIGNRALKDNEMFAICVEKTIDRWSGNLEVGVTGVKFDEIELPATMTDMDHDTWMLSGSTIMKDSQMFKSGYKLNLDNVRVGSVIGMMRRSDGSLHYYLDGVDQGEAYNNVPATVHPVIDLYGQCAQVSLVSCADQRSEFSSNETSHYQSAVNWSDEIPTNTAMFERSQKCFSRWCGKNIDLSEDYTIATRVSSHNHGLVFSSFLLEPDKLYELTVTKWTGEYAGSLSVGVTTISPEKMTLPPTISCLKPDVWYMIGDEIWHNGRMIKAHYGHNLHWLEKWSTVGIRVSMDGALHFYINGQDQGIAANDIPVAVYAVVDLYGSVVEVRMNCQVKDMMASSWLPSLNMTESAVSPCGSSAPNTLAVVKDILRLDDLNAERATMEFYLLKNFEKEKELLSENDFQAKDWKFFRELRGRNIRLMNNGKTARRVESYNQGVVIASRPLERDTMFEVRIDSLNTRWVSSLMIGLLCAPVTRSLLPVTAFGFKKDVWLLCADSVYHNGHKIKARYGPNLDTLSVNQKIGIVVDSNGQLKLYIDDAEQGVAASNIPSTCFVILDVYGQCEQVTITNADSSEECRSAAAEPTLLSANSQESADDGDQVTAVNETSAFCEKADLERHEKESPSDDECSSDECAVPSLSKRNKTNENIAVVASYSHSAPDANVRLNNKMNENNLVNHGNAEAADYPSKAYKTNENNSMAASDSRNDLSSSEEATLDSDRKLSSTMNCDHKTNLNIANATCIQAEKSGAKSSKTILKARNTLNDRPPMLCKQNPNCEYRVRCLRFRDFLGLPGGFFSSDSSIICYCSACYTSANRECKGVPPTSFPVPVGWCKFPLKKHLMTNNVDALTLEKWHVAFVGVAVGSVRRILDRGQLIIPDKLKVGSSETNRQSKLNDESSKYQIVLSPLIKCATDAKYVSKYQYVDQKTKIAYSCTTAFQVLVRPASYKSGTTSAKTVTKSSDHTYQAPNSIEWIVKEKESTVLSAVLFKLEAC